MVDQIICENCGQKPAQVKVGNFQVCVDCEEEIYKEFPYKYKAGNYGLPTRKQYDQHQLEEAEYIWRSLRQSRYEEGHSPCYWMNSEYPSVVYRCKDDFNWQRNRCGCWDFELRRNNVDLFRRSTREATLATMLEF